MCMCSVLCELSENLRDARDWYRHYAIPARVPDAKMDECDMDKSNRQKEVRQSCLR